MQMRTNRWLATAMGAATVLAMTAWSTADPIDARHLAPDARWYVHVDVAKMVASPLGKAMREDWAARDDSRQQLARIRLITGMDPWTDLKGVTIYGPSGDQTEAVAVIHATADPNVIENSVSLAQDYGVIDHGARKIHTWTPDDGQHDTMALCVLNASTYVLGVSSDRVAAAVDAIDRAAAPNATVSALVEQVPADRWLEMAVIDVHTLPRVQERNEWMQNLRQLRMSLGADDKTAMVTLSGTMADASTAQQAKAMLDGFRAMAELRVGEFNPEIVPLLAGLNVQAEGDRVWIDFACPVQTLIDMAREHRAKNDL